MSFKVAIAKVQTLRAEMSANASLMEKIKSAFIVKIKRELSAITTNKEESLWPQAIEQYLQEIWRLTQGSFLCYTAYPTSEVSSCLYVLAELVAAHKNNNNERDNEGRPYTAIQILMPGLLLESNHEGYYDLCAIKRCQQFDARLEAFLANLEASIVRASLPKEGSLFNSDAEKAFQQNLELWAHRNTSKLTETTDIEAFL